ncbi:sulfate transporter family-domain-containing protein [Hyaloraphidium curvatum]|nr:sulfate transporter family-domain-containing protein [Hyaloraphidium curvatum]
MRTRAALSANPSHGRAGRSPPASRPDDSPSMADIPSDLDVLQHTETAPKRDLYATFRAAASRNRQPTALGPRRLSAAAELRRERQKAERKQAVKSYFLGLFPPLQWIPLYFASAKKADVESGAAQKPKVQNAFPLESWKKLLQNDVLAGIQVALMVVPQGMAYATLAQLPPVYGLYSTLFGMFIYPLFGTSRELSVAPVAVNALLMASTLSGFANPTSQADLYLQYVLVTTFLIGVFSLGFGLLNLGYAVTFVSPAVITGFTSGSALVIMVSQLETLFGFSTEKSDYALVTLYRFFANIAKTKWVALLIGLVSLAIMEVLKRIKKARLVPRPLVVVVISTIMAYLFQRFAPQFPLPIVGEVPRGLPPVTVPPLGNSEIMLNSVMPAFLLTIIGFLQSIAVTLRFSEKRGYAVRPSQELNALGLVHIVSSFFSCFDSTGGFSRTAVSVSVGTYSQLSSIVTGIGLILALLVLTPLFYYMPKSALAAIIISAVIPLVDPDAYKRLWRIGQRIDFFVALGTAIVTFAVTAQVGIGVGVGVSLLGVLYNISRPHSTVMGRIVLRTSDEKEEVGEEEEEEEADAKHEDEAPLPPIKEDEWVGEALARRVSKADAGASPASAEVAEAASAEVLLPGAPELPKTKPAVSVAAQADSSGTMNQPGSITVWRNVRRYATEQIPGIVIFRFDANLWFANANYFRERCLAVVRHPDDFGYRVTGQQLPATPANAVASDASGGTELRDLPAPLPTLAIAPPPVKFLVIDATPMNSIDDAGFQSLVSLRATLKDTAGCRLLMAGVKGPCRDVIWRSTKGFTEKGSLGDDMFFRDVDAAVEHAEAEMAAGV